MDGRCASTVVFKKFMCPVLVMVALPALTSVASEIRRGDVAASRRCRLSRLPVVVFDDVADRGRVTRIRPSKVEPENVSCPLSRGSHRSSWFAILIRSSIDRGSRYAVLVVKTEWTRRVGSERRIACVARICEIQCSIGLRCDRRMTSRAAVEDYETGIEALGTTEGQH